MRNRKFPARKSSGRINVFAILQTATFFITEQQRIYGRFLRVSIGAEKSTVQDCRMLPTTGVGKATQTICRHIAGSLQPCQNKKASRLDWRRFYSTIPLYTSGARRLCFIFANSKCFIAEQSGAASSEKADLWSTASPYEAHFVLASFARQASKYMKRHCVPWSEAFSGFIFFCLQKEGKKNGGRSRDRTGDTWIFSPLLYRLS